MEIQQHNGVVVEVAVISAGLRQAQREGEVLRGEREAPGTRVRSPPSPPLYIGALYIVGGREVSRTQVPGASLSPRNTSPSRWSLAKPCRDHRCFHHHTVVLLDLHQPVLPPCWIKKEETSSPTIRVLNAEVLSVQH